MLRTAGRLLPSPALQRSAAAAVRLRSTQPLRTPHTDEDEGVTHGHVDRAMSELQEALGAEPQSQGLTRNPNLSIIGSAAANTLADRRLGDPSLFGPRTADWWTGKAPHEAAGWVAAPAGNGEGHLTSLPQLDLSAACTREQIMDYFDNTWTLTEQLFASLQGEATFYMQPYHQLRTFSSTHHSRRNLHDPAERSRPAKTVPSLTFPCCLLPSPTPPPLASLASLDSPNSEQAIRSSSTMATWPPCT